MDVRAREAGGKQRCPYCHKDDLRGKPIVWCDRCGAMSHAECVAEHGACPVPGCGKPLTVENLGVCENGKGASSLACKYGINGCTSKHEVEWDSLTILHFWEVEIRNRQNLRKDVLGHMRLGMASAVISLILSVMAIIFTLSGNPEVGMLCGSSALLVKFLARGTRVPGGR